MILIAPDKFKGTLTAREAANAIAEALSPLSCIRMPMADGGEGTAEILCAGPQWQKRDGYYVNRNARTAVIDSASQIGMKALYGTNRRPDILKVSSAPLGLKVREIIKGGCDKVIIGIGGTATCDGGLGFLEALDMDKLHSYRDKIVGLADVKVPLVAPIGQPSALMFTPQKGATTLDLQILEERLEHLQHKYSHGRKSPYDGAGGGLGFAIATVIGAECHDGAKYVLDHLDIKWDAINLVITGEGCIDAQTDQGKVVATVQKAAAEHDIPCIAIGGCVRDGKECDNIISAEHYLPELPLNKETAALRLQAAVTNLLPIIKQML